MNAVRSNTLVLGLALGALLAAGAAQADLRGGGGGGARAGGRTAQSSIAGANRQSRGNVNRTASRNNVGNGSNNNINIGNDVDIDIDRDYGHGHWDNHYHPVAAGIVVGAVAVTTAAVVGSYYYRLPTNCTTVYKNGEQIWLCGSAYYRRTWYGNDVVYVVVAP